MTINADAQCDDCTIELRGDKIPLRYSLATFRLRSENDKTVHNDAYSPPRKPSKGHKKVSRFSVRSRHLRLP